MFTGYGVAMFQKELKLILCVFILILLCDPGYTKPLDCSDMFSDSDDEETEGMYDFEYDKLLGRNKVKNKLVTQQGVRLNDIGIVLELIADMFDTMYFDTIEQTSGTYMYHGSDVKYRDIKMILSKIDSAMESFCEHIMLGEDELDEFEALQKDPENKDSRIQKHRIEMNPDIVMIIVFGILKQITPSPSRLWQAYLEEGDKTYEVRSYLDPYRSFPENVINFSNPIFSKYLPISLQKRVISSVLLYYSLKFSSNPKYHTTELIQVGDEICSVEELKNLDFEKKKKRYVIRANSKNSLKQGYLSQVSLDNIEEHVESNYIFERIQSMETFRRAVTFHPYLKDQDLLFVFKFFKYSIYSQDFIKELSNTFPSGDVSFIEYMVQKSDILDMYQIYYIGQYAFSIDQILKIFATTEDSSLTPDAIMSMLLNLYGGGMNVDKIRMAVNLEMLFHHKYNGTFSRTIKKHLRSGKFEYTYDVEDLNQIILKGIENNAIRQSLEKEKGLFIDGENIEQFGKAVEKARYENEVYFNQTGEDDLIFNP